MTGLFVVLCLVALLPSTLAMPLPMPFPQADWSGSGSIMDAMDTGGGGPYSASNHFSNPLASFNSFSNAGFWGK